MIPMEIGTTELTTVGWATPIPTTADTIDTAGVRTPSLRVYGFISDFATAR
jgi:hypothetical protein